MTRQTAEDLLAQWDQDAVFADGFDDCIIGILYNTEYSKPVVVYDEGACVSVLSETMGDDAKEFFDFNVVCAYTGPQTSLFVTT